MKTEPGYEPLAQVLQDALDQAQYGKGKQCHANGLPFLEQEILKEGRTLGPLGHVFQVRKKVREAANCTDDSRAIEDLLGAIVYTAAMVILRREKMKAAIAVKEIDAIAEANRRANKARADATCAAAKV